MKVAYWALRTSVLSATRNCAKVSWMAAIRLRAVIDAFAERVGQEILVQWLDTNDALGFRVSDRDGKIENGD